MEKSSHPFEHAGGPTMSRGGVLYGISWRQQLGGANAQEESPIRIYDDPFSGLVTGTRRIRLAACMLVSGCDLG
jgi:hypothetical protein